MSHVGNSGLTWSRREKEAARALYELAYDREFAVVAAGIRKIAAKLAGPEDLRELGNYLRATQRELDRLFDFRYSVLLDVFLGLVRRGTLKREELEPLGAEKLALIDTWLRYGTES